ncbi:MAG: phosphonate C-P lyase system protein PhnG [Rhodoplanes sp.]|uniref:phosphonate C-P lyase system protein PhnG n=1 Tax=Rhodoplanes sp. TaxID=1968906 RepID=UPI0017C62DE3|nr:phosphonate C-P lyase system protein PhnG [Rhodoplanes sp.]NVO16226.1 phosphonate C-P lyase system protein PhnG [Rhodoplanes sp.]
MSGVSTNGVAMRRAVMAVLVEASATDLAALVSQVAVPEHDMIRRPEIGLVMVQGRVGGDGQAFNLGEATVTRAAVRLASGETGFSCMLGRDPEKARLVALCDALVQTDAAPVIERAVVAPLRARLAEVQKLAEARTAATRVDFFTLVRGED